MRRLVLVALFAAAFHPAAAPADGGKWISGQQGEREYRLYVPTSYANSATALVVMLHGCTQSAETFAESTQMNALAEEGRFLVLYPIQKASANPTRCWNWFQPKNQVRGSGEPAEIVAVIEQVSSQYSVDRKRVYAAGLSAGASMTAILAACYPDVFAAAAVHDGTMYKSASGLLEAQKVMQTAKTPDPESLAGDAWACGGKRELTMPVMVWHGQGDNIVNRKNGDQVVRQFVALNDLADDGEKNGSVKEMPATRSDPGRSEYRYTVTAYGSRGRRLIEYYKIEELGHAWSGGKDDLLFSDAKGPAASALMWRFFKQFSR
jgi:poly(hydroxyalkanoate) depolymerase family esterase